MKGDLQEETWAEVTETLQVETGTDLTDELNAIEMTETEMTTDSLDNHSNTIQGETMIPLKVGEEEDTMTIQAKNLGKG